MKGYDWMGTPPENPEWSVDNKEIYFRWNPEQELMASDYKYIVKTGKIVKLTTDEKVNRIPAWSRVWDKANSKFLYTQGGKLYLFDVATGKNDLLLNLDPGISSPQFSADESVVYFTQGSNMFKYQLSNGRIDKLTNFVKSASARPEKGKWSNDQEEWLYKDQMELFDVLKEKKKVDDVRSEERKAMAVVQPVAIPYGDSRASTTGITSDEKFITFSLFKMSEGAKGTEMPRYVTETGFTEVENTRSKVGDTFGEMKFGIFDIVNDTFYFADITGLPGIYDYMVYGEEQTIEKRDEPKQVMFSSPIWSPAGDKLVVNVRSGDNKDRWIASVDLETGRFTSLDHQRDEAWISGPGIGWFGSAGTLGWLPDNKTIFFQSEESGYSHLYIFDTNRSKKSALTSGDFEISNLYLSKDKKSFYFSSNEVHSGETHFYRMGINGSGKKQLTTREGQNNVTLSSDEQTMLIEYSFANKPSEFFISTSLGNDKWSDYKQITDSYTDQFKSYGWKTPDFINVPASDGKMIPSRIYRPDEAKKNGRAVIFVHGAGYLQNAHKGWSSYYREYMFHNFLVDNGYTVLDMDYRASAGYGSYWRSAIYRHMGGKDLSDNIDGATYLVEKEGINKESLGIYGGSYGGFITLMAQFTAPGVFKAGVALRPVTDWAHYNHGYTANILNTPVEDPIAYRRSSPIYFADGLQDHLIMCHGMVDSNVHFQDVVRLAQRLIELQKDNWEVAMYPIENHSFTTWTSWLDEYKRIYNLFEDTLK
jgi:dipeptidyl aminopeptidase/acylaminoacyl peptidase